jgi:ABC-type glycerol-3-phosphate transport system permease component
MYKPRSILKQILYQAILAAIGVFVLLPIASMVRLAFDGSIIVAPTDFRLFPKEFTLDIFRQIWVQP